MGKLETTAIAYTCDGCGKTRTSINGELPEGFHGGPVNRVGKDDARVSEWFADRKECIGKAIRNAFEGGNQGPATPADADPNNHAPAAVTGDAGTAL